MRFQVPQYIEVEDKIIGPLTFKQFVYIAGGVGLSFVFYYFVKPFILSLLFIAPILIFSIMLAFYKFNNKPFAFFLEVFFYYLIGDKLYIWKKTKRTPAKMAEEKRKKEEEKEIANQGIKRVSASNLRDLSWKLDMKETEDKLTEDL